MDGTSTDRGPSGPAVNLGSLFEESPIAYAPPSTAYRIGLAAVALVMVTLPAVYLTLIGLIVALLYQHAVGAIDLIRTSPHWLFASILYFGPFFLGLVLLAFLLKPFYARPLGGVVAFALEPDREPLFFETVRRLCVILKAPPPQRIEVDCQANASASFDTGLFGLIRKNFVLTVGLPLAAGATITQFGGILAHELGHFSQRWGMLLTYIVRSVDEWLSQSVYARDEWDAFLERWSQKSRWPLSLPFLLARALVWLCRRILWILMLIGHLVSCYMLRQMEYNADTAEARVAGREDFERACLCLVDLNAAAVAASENLEIGWRQDRLPDNLPEYIVRQALPEERRAEIREAALRERTGIFDSHPALGDRIQAIARANLPAPESLPAPAGALFANFEELCRDVTRFHYRKNLGLEFRSCSLVNVQRAISQDITELRAWSASMTLFRGAASTLRPFPLSNDDLVAARPMEDTVRWMMSARMRVEHPIVSAESAHRRFVDADSRLVDLQAARTLLSVGFAIRPQQFGLHALDADSLAAAEQQALTQKARAENDLRLFDTDVRTRVAAALQLLQFEAFRARLPDGESLPAEVKTLVRSLVALRQINDLQAKLRIDSLRLGLLLANRYTAPDQDELQVRLADATDWVGASLNTLRGLFKDVPYPFLVDGRKVSFSDHIWENQPKPQTVEAVNEQAGVVSNRLYSMYYGILGRLADITEQVERCAYRPAPRPPHGKNGKS